MTTPSSPKPQYQTSGHQDAEAWEKLAVKIFSRWVNQKLQAKGISVADVTTGLSTGTVLIALMETLSEKTFSKKYAPAPKMRVQQIETVNLALGFCWECGVQMQLKPSAENIVDGNKTQVLGLLWAIMKKYMVFDEDEEGKAELSAKDSLQMWITNQVAGYKGVKIDNMTKSFHDGLALCALIHHFRPKLINFDSLSPANALENIKTAFIAAEKFFGLEQYLSPADLLLLDEKSMVVYLSEYFYGVANQRKIDLANRRIHALIQYTKKNDQLKKQYNDNAKKFRSDLEAKGHVLDDRTIDNTMAGARRRLDDFNAYKTGEKQQFTGAYLGVEDDYNNLSLRLADHKRPEFKTDAGNSLPELRGSLDVLEKHEVARKLYLHTELNRQIKLAKENEQHKTRFEALLEWGKRTADYLTTKEVIHSVGEAIYQINTLEARDGEMKTVHAGSFAELKRVGAHLAAEKFEGTAEVEKRHADVETKFSELHGLSTQKMLVLKDDLARELFAEKVRGWNAQHVGKHDKLMAFVAEKKAYLSVKESIRSIADAELQLSLLRSYEIEKKNILAANIEPLHKLGQDITSAKYETQYSRWVFETPADIGTRQAAIDAGFKELDALSHTKLGILEDDLAREKFKADLLARNQQHVNMYNILAGWIGQSKAYLGVKESVHSISDAETQIGLLHSWHTEKNDLTRVSVPPLKALGAEIIAAEYKTSLSSYKFETPDEIQKRESTVDSDWAALDQLHATKSAILQDDLDREKFREMLRQWNQQHINKYNTIQKFIAEKKEYLLKKEEVNSISEAEEHLATQKQYEADKKEITDLTLVALKKFGAEIASAEYKTALSEYKFPTPHEITGREHDCDGKFGELDMLSAKKRAVLEDDLAREKFKEKLRQWNRQHIDKFNKLKTWVTAKDAYLNVKEPVDSIPDAEKNLSVHRAYTTEKTDKLNVNVSGLKSLGHETVTAKYQTDLSSWVFPTPEEIKARETEIDTDFHRLDELSAKKKAILDDDLARERFREQLRLWNSQHIDKHTKIAEWITASTTLLNKKEPCNSIADANQNLTNLAQYEADKVDVTNINVASLKKLGNEILTAKYETPLSSFVFRTPEEIKSREQMVDDQWVVLTTLSTAKRAVLDADLEREKLKEKLRLEFANLANDYTRWVTDVDNDTKNTVFGFTLDEVEAAKAPLDDDDKRLTAEGATKVDGYSKVHQQATELGVTHNSYTTHSPATLAAEGDKMKGSLAARQARYAADLKKQQENDALCKKFAERVDPFTKHINKIKDEISNNKADLPVQLQATKDAIKAAEADKSLGEIEAIQAQIDAAGISNNKHTSITAVDASVQWKQFTDFLSSKQKTIEKEIAHKALRGVTPEQYSEIENQFKQFDKDKSGFLDRTEFKACLYSLGEEKGKTEVKALIEKYGNKDGKISYDGFKEFMIVILGDTETPEEINQGFKLINRHTDHTVDSLMQMVMEDDDIAFIKSTAPKKDAGHDYAAWTAEVFAR